MTAPTHARCTPPGYLKHLNDAYPPTAKEHSLLPRRVCLLLKPPFWKNKTWYHRNGAASSLPLPLSIGIKVCLFSWPCCFSLPFRYRRRFVFLGPFPPPANPTRCRWSGAYVRAREGWVEWRESRDPLAAGNGGSLQHTVEFYTLHLHLQQWRPGIWHTTPILAGARRLHTQQWNFTLEHFRPLYAHVSPPLQSETTKKGVLQSRCRDSWPTNLCNFMPFCWFFSTSFVPIAFLYVCRVCLFAFVHYTTHIWLLHVSVVPVPVSTRLPISLQPVSLAQHEDCKRENS